MRRTITTLGALVVLGFLAPQAHAQLELLDRKADGEDAGVDALRGAYATAISPDGKHVYAPGSLDNGLVVFSKDPVSGELGFVEDHVDGSGGITSLGSCRGVAVSPDGKHVYTAALTDSAVTVFSRDSGSGELTFVQALADAQSGGSVEGLGGAMSVVVSPDGKHVYVGARSDDAVVAFSRDADSGALTLVASYVNGSGGISGLDAPETIVLSPDGAHLYAAAETSQSIAGFSRDDSSGALGFVGAWFDGVGGFDGLGCVNALDVSPDGAHVYAVGQFGAATAPFCTVGFDDWMAVLARNPSTGELAFLGAPSPGLFDFPPNCGGVSGDNGVAVSVDGTRVIATLQWHAAVVELDRDPGTGLVTPASFRCADLADPDAVIDLLSAHRVVADPGGDQVLVTALSPGTVLVYALGLFGDGFESGDTTRWASETP